MSSRKAQKATARTWFGQWRHGTAPARKHVLATHTASPSSSQALAAAPYRVCLATKEDERHAAFGLRFRVFNLEMNEGLESSYLTGEDTDAFDSVCDHLIVRHAASGEV